ncbi:hypothetical protein Pst134EA_029449 [Puccinia striiformis f. sp. tritici]|uniref:hypothetical protein n=1 Tax=Puccinia striiformis f. sp. tritici TaxID=168172 RepID=UPI00200754F9|nr:hypothetical protein Pst134EA_029449 [Puccinia striiformis f. sp. tritici]KAH9447410.1 hypothetical protein Pst134EA_029449 [Puccinia striiformis f. sp. tritici]
MTHFRSIINIILYNNLIQEKNSGIRGFVILLPRQKINPTIVQPGINEAIPSLISSSNLNIRQPGAELPRANGPQLN